MRLGWRGRLWQAAGVPPWVFGRSLIRAGHAFVRLHFRLWERAVQLPPGAIVVLLDEERRQGPKGARAPRPAPRGQAPPTEDHWSLAVAEITRQLRRQPEEDSR